MKNKKRTKRILAAILTMILLTGMSLTASAKDIVWDSSTNLFYYQGPDVSAVANQWAEDEEYGWIFFGPDGVSMSYCYDKIYPLKVGPDGRYYADKRVRSATGQPGQQPVFSMPSAQKDIRYTGLRQMLDAIPLYPDATTYDQDLDAMLDIIFAQIITPDMDTHDKLKACYDFLVMNIGDSRYEEVPVVPAPWAVFDLDPRSTVEYCSSEHYSITYVLAGEMLQWSDGVCDNFSAAFAVMAWKIGVPMYLVSGQVAGGAAHNWCQLDGPDGITYIFDPHIDHLNKIRGNGTNSYSRFGATEAQMAGKYKTIAAIKDI